MKKTMKNSYKSIALVAAMAAVMGLSGCAVGNLSTKKDDTATIQQKIQKGKTTKAQVLEMYGKPTVTTNSGSNEIWQYAYGQMDLASHIPVLGMLIGGMNGKEVTITFNKAGIVTDLQVSEINT